MRSFLWLNRRKSIFWFWIISYLAIIIVCILLSFAAHLYSLNVVKKEVAKTNEAMLGQVKIIVDGYLSEIVKMAITMEANDKIWQFMNKDMPIDEDDNYRMYEVYKEIRTYQLSNSMVDLLYVYYQNSDKCIASDGIYTTQTLYQSTYRADYSMQELLAVLQSPRGNLFFTVPDRTSGTGTKSAAGYAHTMAVSDTSPARGTIVVHLDGKRLLRVINSAISDAVEGIAIVDENNQIICTTLSNIVSTSAFGTIPFSDGMTEITLGGTTFLSTHFNSEVAGWKYILFASPDFLSEKLRRIQMMMAGAILLCLLVGGCFTFIFAQRNYMPIRKMMALLANTPAGLSDSGTANEYDILNRSISSTLLENESIQQQMRGYHDTLRDNYVNKLLKGHAIRSVSDVDSPNYFGIRFISSYFAVVLYHIEDCSVISSGNTDEDKKLIVFVISKLGDEVFGESCRTYTIETESMVGCLLNLPCDYFEVAEKVGCIQKLLIHHYKIDTIATLSNLQQGDKLISQAYYEALEAMQYRQFVERNTMITYQDIKPEMPASQAYDYSVEREIRLINLIKAGEFDSAKTELTHILEQNKSLPLPLMRLLLMNLVSTMVKVAGDIDIVRGEDITEGLNPIEQLLGGDSMDEAKAAMFRFLDHLHIFMVEHTRSRGILLKDQLLEYLQSSYQNPTINIETTALHFQRNPLYLSRFFKANTGRSMLDYLNHLRIERAKTLLLQTQMTIGEIAQSSGFYNHTTFIRAFKKQEGITPSCYRSVHQSDMNL